MGEAKRRKAAGTSRNGTARSWAVGAIHVIANDVPCFSWRGTREDAEVLQQNHLATMTANAAVTGYPFEPQSYAKKAAGYLMAYGMPAEGDVDRRPINHGTRWDSTNIEGYKQAVLWLALREHVPAGGTIADAFPGKALIVSFTGDKQQIEDDTVREMTGQPFSGENFQMMVGIAEHELLLDPKEAVPIRNADLFARAGAPPAKDDRFADTLVYVPRIPVDAAEAKAMLAMTTIVVDATDTALAAGQAGANPRDFHRTYCGYTDAELSGGKPHVRIARPSI